MRTEDGVHYGDVLDAVDFPYLVQVTRLNAITMAALAMAPTPPAMVKTEGAVSMDTTVSWTAVPAARYRQVARHHRAEVEQQPIRHLRDITAVEATSPPAPVNALRTNTAARSR